MIEEIETAIREINYLLWEQVGMDDFNLPLKVNSNGDTQVITFADVQVWHSEDDERGYTNEEEDIREPIEDYLRREIRKQLVNFSQMEV